MNINNGISGIYSIRFKTDNGYKFYVGQSVCIKKRLMRHLWELKNNKSKNPKMQNAYNKHGVSSLYFSIEMECDKDKNCLAINEKYILDGFLLKYGKENIYNILLDRIDSRLGIKASQETKLKISQSHKNLPMTDDRLARIKKMISSNIGRKLSEESIKKRTEKQTGLKRSLETRVKLSVAMKNRPPMSDETKRKISETKKRLNQKPSSDHMKMLALMAKDRGVPKSHTDMLAAMKVGKKQSEESIKKRTETRRKNAESLGRKY